MTLGIPLEIQPHPLYWQSIQTFPSQYDPLSSRFVTSLFKPHSLKEVSRLVPFPPHPHNFPLDLSLQPLFTHFFQVPGDSHCKFQSLLFYPALFPSSTWYCLWYPLSYTILIDFHDSKMFLVFFFFCLYTWSSSLFFILNMLNSS